MPPVSIEEARIKLTQWHEERLKREVDEHQRLLKQVDSTFLARQLLSSAGFDVKEPPYLYDAYHLDLDVNKEDIITIRQALGCKLPVYEKRAVTPESGKLKDVKINWVLRPVDFPGVSIRFLTDPPKKKRGQKARCVIKKIKVKGYTTTELVCET